MVYTCSVSISTLRSEQTDAFYSQAEIHGFFFFWGGGITKNKVSSILVVLKYKKKRLNNFGRGEGITPLPIFVYGFFFLQKKSRAYNDDRRS